MQAPLVALGGTLRFLLEIDNLAGDEIVALVSLIVFSQLAIGYAKFVGKTAECVSLTYLYIIVAVEGVDGMEIVVACEVTTVACEELVVALCTVVSVELV